VCLLFLTCLASADTYIVDPGGGYDYTTIQQAIEDAVNGDTIIVNPDTYYENINMAGTAGIAKAITLQSTDPNNPAVVAATIIDGGGSGSVITCNSDETPDTVINGFTITNGNSSNGGGFHLNTHCDPTISNCVVTGNTGSTYGGGFYCYAGSDPKITNCIISNNTSTYGGGIYCMNTSSPTVTNCKILSNTATSQGAGMYINNSSDPVVTNCVFSNNNAQSKGGAIYSWYGGTTPVITNCTFYGNSATSRGGAIYAYNNTIVTMANCILWANEAPSNPEIYVSGATFQITYSCIEDGYSGTGNIESNPKFIDPNGADDIIGTPDDDFTLLYSSLCIDAGNNSAVPAEILYDIKGDPRFWDNPEAPDSGSGSPPIVDMGANEFFDDDGDLDDDGVPDTIDNCPIKLFSSSDKWDS